MKKVFLGLVIIVSSVSCQINAMNWQRSYKILAKRLKKQSKDNEKLLIKDFFTNLYQQDPNVVFGGNTMLHRLITWYLDRKNHYYLNLIEVLLRDPRTRTDLKNEHGLTALDLAQNNKKILQAIKNRECIILHDAFIAAVRSKNVIAAKNFLEKPNLKVNDLSFECHVLHYAVLQLDYEMVKILLTHPDLDLNIQDWRGETPLHLLVKWASMYPDSRCLALVELLLADSRTRCDVPNRSGKTIFDLATNDLVQGMLRERGLGMPQLIRKVVTQEIMQASDLVL